MEIQGSGDYRRYRESQGMAFGSREWNEHHHGGRAPKRRTDRANRARTQAGSKVAQADHLAALAEWEQLQAWEAECAQIVQAYRAEAPSMARVARNTAGKAHALTVQVVPLAAWPVGVVEELQAAGFHWTSRKGGKWWAPRTEEACELVQRLCSDASEDFSSLALDSAEAWP